MKDLSFHYKDGVGIEYRPYLFRKVRLLELSGKMELEKQLLPVACVGLRNGQEVYSRSEVEHTATGSG